MAATTVKITLYRPGPLGDTVPANGYVECTPTVRRHVEGATPPDMVVLPVPFKVRLGEALYDDDGTTLLQAATDGVGWARLEPTDAGDYAGLWAWKFTERTADGTTQYALVPTSGSIVDYGDLEVVDITTLDPVTPPSPAWAAALAAETEAREDADTALQGDIAAEALARDTADDALGTRIDDLVAGAPGALDTLNELAAALGDDANYAAGVATQIADLNTDVTDLNTALDAKADRTYETSGVELAYAENGTATTTTIPISAAASTSIPGCNITIPANADPVYVEYGGAINVTQAGGGLIALELWDVTAGGTGTQIHTTGFGVTAAQLTLYSGLAQSVSGRHRIDASTSDRILQLKCLLYRDGGSSLTAAVANAARGGAGQPTFLTAVQR